MAISVLQRPYGYLWGDVYQGSSNESIQDDGGDAIVSLNSPHGIVSAARTIYVKSTVANYNGIKIGELVNATHFYICESQEGTLVRVPFIKTAVGDEFSFQIADDSHGWNCVHLPIIYKLSNTLYPTNSADTVRTISSVTDDDDYCAIVASGDIKASGSAAALEFVKITGATDDDLNGVWQIISYTNDTTFTLDLPYSSANDTALTGASIQYYYNNYHVKVQVWGGLDNGHPYYAQEPYELLATLSLIPDEDGICQFSIHEILKKNIQVKNNLLLGTLPYNLDAFTKFFIKYCEVYDDSDGSTLSTLTESYTSDLGNFEGIAVNAMLPFKNIYAGALSEYVEAQKALTPFTRPTIFEGKYFDLSFLWEGVHDLYYRFEWYLNDVLQTTTFSDTFDGFYTGVYRGQITEDCDYDRVDVTTFAMVYDNAEILSNSQFHTGGVLSPWTSVAGAGLDWAQAGGSNPAQGRAEVTFPDGAGSSDILRQDFSDQAAGKYHLLLRTILSTSGSVLVTVNVYNGSTLVKEILSQAYTNTAATDFTYTVDIPATFDRIEITASRNGSGSLAFSVSTASLESAGNELSETKTIDIDCGCTRSKATGYYLSWLNYLGGFDYWYFNGYADHIIDITDSGETQENTFPTWPNSYGEFADTISKQTFKQSRRQIMVRSQNLTLTQLQAIEYIKTSPLVTIVNSIYDRRTVLVDSDSFTSYREGQTEQYTISFTITYTDDVPSQTV